MYKKPSSESLSPNRNARKARKGSKSKQTATKAADLHCRQVSPLRLAEALYAAGTHPMAALKAEREIIALARAAAASGNLVDALRRAGAL